MNAETPPERLWWRESRPGRMTVLPLEGTRGEQNRQNSSGAYRRRKVPAHEPRFTGQSIVFQDYIAKRACLFCPR